MFSVDHSVSKGLTTTVGNSHNSHKNISHLNLIIFVVSVHSDDSANMSKLDIILLYVIKFDVPK